LQFALTPVVLLLTLSVGCNRTKKYPLQGEVVAKMQLRTRSR